MAKNIVILCDGTGNKIGRDERTNIVDMLQDLEISEKQIVYYDMGVGTQSIADFWVFRKLGLSRIVGKIGMTFRKATGAGVRANVRQAYRFLMDTYEQGDRVFLFGFSRGAYTARLIAGLLMKVGLLRPGNFQLVDEATNLYFNKAPQNDVAAFKRVATRACDIHFVGVFDTVASMALLFNVDFFSDNALHPKVSRGVHAVSIDDRRSKFRPNLWDVPADQIGKRVEQVWFAGVHSDVGGWYRDRSLSAVALRWMLKHARNDGLLAPDEFLAKIEERADPEGPQHESYKGFWTLVPGGDKRRAIPKGARVHDSVKVRRASSKIAYNPPNLPPDGDLVYVPDPEPS